MTFLMDYPKIDDNELGLNLWLKFISYTKNSYHHCYSKDIPWLLESSSLDLPLLLLLRQKCSHKCYINKTLVGIMMMKHACKSKFLACSTKVAINTMRICKRQKGKFEHVYNYNQVYMYVHLEKWRYSAWKKVANEDISGQLNINLQNKNKLTTSFRNSLYPENLFWRLKLLKLAALFGTHTSSSGIVTPMSSVDFSAGYTECLLKMLSLPSSAKTCSMWRKRQQFELPWPLLNGHNLAASIHSFILWALCRRNILKCLPMQSHAHTCKALKWAYKVVCLFVSYNCIQTHAHTRTYVYFVVNEELYINGWCKWNDANKWKWL